VRVQPLDTTARRLALGGAVGVTGFVAAWAIRGATREGYSSIDDAISQLAATGAPGRHWMNTGFLAFGIGVPMYAIALRRALPGAAWATATATGLCTLAVSAAPLGSADTAHNLAAGAGYLTLAATPLLAARQFWAQGQRVWAAWSVVAGLGSALALLASISDDYNGLFQRLGLGFTDVWILVSAVTMWRTGRLGGDGLRIMSR